MTGPGAYSVGHERLSSRTRAPAYSLAPRGEHRSSWQGSPGPGAYNAEKPQVKIAFSMTPRRQDLAASNTPGPLDYVPVKPTVVRATHLHSRVKTAADSSVKNPGTPNVCILSCHPCMSCLHLMCMSCSHLMCMSCPHLMCMPLDYPQQYVYSTHTAYVCAMLQQECQGNLFFILHIHTCTCLSMTRICIIRVQVLVPIRQRSISTVSRQGRLDTQCKLLLSDTYTCTSTIYTDYKPRHQLRQVRLNTHNTCMSCDIRMCIYIHPRITNNDFDSTEAETPRCLVWLTRPSCGMFLT
jgi:hypothetical protein